MRFLLLHFVLFSFLRCTTFSLFSFFTSTHCCYISRVPCGFTFHSLLTRCSSPPGRTPEYRLALPHVLTSFSHLRTCTIPVADCLHRSAFPGFLHGLPGTHACAMRLPACIDCRSEVVAAAAPSRPPLHMFHLLPDAKAAQPAYTRGADGSLFASPAPHMPGAASSLVAVPLTFHIHTPRTFTVDYQAAHAPRFYGTRSVVTCVCISALPAITLALPDVSRFLPWDKSTFLGRSNLRLRLVAVAGFVRGYCSARCSRCRTFAFCCLFDFALHTWVPLATFPLTSVPYATRRLRMFAPLPLSRRLYAFTPRLTGPRSRWFSFRFAGTCVLHFTR